MSATTGQIQGGACTCTCYPVRFISKFQKWGAQTKFLRLPMNILSSCESSTPEEVTTPEIRHFARDASTGKISFFVRSPADWGHLIDHWCIMLIDTRTWQHTLIDYFAGRDRELYFETDEPWEGLLLVELMYAEHWGVEDTRQCYLDHYDVPEFTKLVVPDPLDFSQLRSNEHPEGSGCVQQGYCPGEPDCCYDCTRPPTDNCLKRRYGGYYDHINPPSDILLRCAGLVDNTFYYSYSSGNGLCAQVTIEARWMPIGYFGRADTARPPSTAQWEAITGCSGMVADIGLGYRSEWALRPPPWLVPVAIAHITINLVGNEAGSTAATFSQLHLERWQLLGSPMSYQSVLAMYRNITELQAANCDPSDTDGGWPCMPQAGNSFREPEDSLFPGMICVVPVFNPLFLFRSRNGTLVSGVSPWGNFNGFYMSGDVWQSDSSLGGPRFANVLTRYNAAEDPCPVAKHSNANPQGISYWCPDYSMDPLAGMRHGCPGNLQIGFSEYAELLNLVYDMPNRVHDLPMRNRVFPFELRVDNGDNWPNALSKCRCVEDLQGDAGTWGYSYVEGVRTSLLYVQRQISTEPQYEACNVECFGNDPHADPGQDPKYIEADVFPRSIGVSLPESIETGWLNCIRWTDIYAGHYYRPAALPRIAYLHTSGCPDMWRGRNSTQGNTALRAFHHNYGFASIYDHDVIVCRYRLPQPDPPIPGCWMQSVYLDIGYIGTTVNPPAGPDPAGTRMVRLFTQCRIEIVIGGYLFTLYSANVFKELNLYDYGTDAVNPWDNFARFNSEFDWTPSFDFSNFAFLETVRHPDDGAYRGCDTYSFNDAYWRIGCVRKMAGVPEDYTNFCPSPTAGLGYWCFRGRNVTADFRVSPVRRGGLTQKCDGPDGSDWWLRYVETAP